MQIPSNIRQQNEIYEQARRVSEIICSGDIPLSFLDNTLDGDTDSSNSPLKDPRLNLLDSLVEIFHPCYSISFGADIKDLLDNHSKRIDKTKYEQQLKDILTEALKDSSFKDDLAHTIMKMPPKLQERFIRSTFDREQQAKESKVKIIMKFVGSIDKNHTSLGKYRLYMQNAARQEELIQFSTRHSFALYTLYLLDRKLSKFVDKLNVDEYKNQIANIASLVYDEKYDEKDDQCFGKYMYDRLSEINNGSNRISKNVKDTFRNNCFAAMRTAIESTCEKLHESGSIFTIQQPNKHLLMLPQNILFDTTFLDCIQSVNKC